MSNNCREAIPEVREALPDVRELSGGSPRSSGGPPGCPGVVRTHSRMSLWGGRPFRMSGSCREALPNMKEALPVVREW